MCFFMVAAGCNLNHLIVSVWWGEDEVDISVDMLEVTVHFHSVISHQNKF